MSDISIRYGQTRSGKLIDSLFLEKTNDFSTKDLFDAYGLLSYLTIREKRKRGETKQFDHFEVLLKECYELLTKKYIDINILFLDAGLKSAFDLYNFGRSLAFIEFHDP